MISKNGKNTAEPIPLPKMTVIFTLNNRPEDTMKNVFESFIGQDYDQMIIVLDRPEPGVEEYARQWWRDTKAKVAPDFVKVDGERGWLGPARAWNAGFARIRNEITYCISSEVIQQEGNCAKMKALMAGPPLVVFGRAEDDGPMPVVNSEHPNLLCGSIAVARRPLGFIVAMPTWVLRTINGFDETFMEGYWYDDDDFTFKMWRLGVPYLFEDDIFGIHQHHDRRDLSTERGRKMIQKNHDYIVSKWGDDHPWNKALGGYAEGKGRAIVFPKSAPGAEEFYENLVEGPVIGRGWSIG